MQIVLITFRVFQIGSPTVHFSQIVYNYNTVQYRQHAIHYAMVNALHCYYFIINLNMSVLMLLI